LNYFFIVFCIFLLYNFSFLIYGFSWLPDIVTRLNLNDSLLNTYHFLWVTALYLSPFYFILFTLFFFFTYPYLNLYYATICSIFYLVYSTEVLDFLVFNFQELTGNNVLLQFNTLLVNNLNKTHPFIFYSGTLLLFTLIISFYWSSFNVPKFSQTEKLKSFYNLPSLIFFVSTVALFLGSWWAIQEGTWGGWWNWDPSETFGLLFTLTALISIHTPLFHDVLINFQLKLKVLTLVLVFSYFFIQLNFDLVSHNFGAKFFYFFNNKLFFNVLLILLIYQLTTFSYQIAFRLGLKGLLQTKHEKNRFSFNWLVDTFKLIPFSVILTVILTSFSLLFNYFIWNFLNFNLLNFDINRGTLNVSFVIILGLFVYRFDSFTLPISLVTCLGSHNFLYLLWYNVVSWKNSVTKLHNLLILLLVVNLLNLNSSFILWHLYSFSENLLLENGFLTPSSSIFTCDYVFVEKSSLYKTFSLEWFSAWNFFLYSNTPVSNTFFLTFSNSVLMNFYELFDLANTCFILIENNFTTSLPTLLVGFLAYYVKMLFTTSQQNFY